MLDSGLFFCLLLPLLLDLSHPIFNCNDLPTFRYLLVFDAFSELGQPAEGLLTVAALVVGETFFGRPAEAFYREQWMQDRAKVTSAEERVVRALDDAQATATRVQQEIAEYVFHELRNDINATMWVLELIANELDNGRGSLSPSTIADLHDGKVHASHAVLVISNMMDFSKLRAGKLVLASKPLVLERLSSDATRLTKQLVRGDVVLSATVEPELAVMGSEFHLKQVLLNLLSNACKHTEHGSVTLTVKDMTQETSEPMRIIRFAITDTGSGVPLHKRATIFEEYEQAQSASVVQAGTGLGLPLCKALIRLMGSSIHVDCPPSGGSVFSFDLSMQRSEHPDVSSAESADATEEEALLPEGLRILLADDILLNCRFFEARISKLLCKPVFRRAASGEEVLEVLDNEEAFDLCVMDNIFGHEPDALTGLAATQRIREAQIASSRGDPLPIIGASGNEGVGFNELAFEVGQNAVWGKPLPNDAEMLRDLRRVLCQRQ